MKEYCGICRHISGNERVEGTKKFLFYCEVHQAYFEKSHKCDNWAPQGRMSTHERLADSINVREEISNTRILNKTLLSNWKVNVVCTVLGAMVGAIVTIIVQTFLP